MTKELEEAPRTVTPLEIAEWLEVEADWNERHQGETFVVNFHPPTLRAMAATVRTLLSALSRGDGWRLMPTEATPEMLDAGHMADVPWEFEELDGTPVLGPFALEISGPNKPDRAKDIVAYLYRAMIAAAPPVPEGEE